MSSKTCANCGQPKTPSRPLIWYDNRWWCPGACLLPRKAKPTVTPPPPATTENGVHEALESPPDPAPIHKGPKMRADDPRLQEAMKIAVAHGMLPRHANEETYLKNWNTMGQILTKVLSMSADAEQDDR